MIPNKFCELPNESLYTISFHDLSSSTKDTQYLDTETFTNTKNIISYEVSLAQATKLQNSSI